MVWEGEMLAGVKAMTEDGSAGYSLAIATGPSDGGFCAGYGAAAGELSDVDVFSEGEESERSA